MSVHGMIDESIPADGGIYTRLNPNLFFMNTLTSALKSVADAQDPGPELLPSTELTIPVESAKTAPANLVMAKDAHVSAADVAQLSADVGIETEVASWDERLSKASRMLSMRDEHGRLVGFAQLMQYEDLNLFVDGMVHPDFQGQGVFKDMMDTGIAELRAEGHERVYLDPAPGTEAMYQHLGWTPVEGGLVHVDAKPNES